MNLNISDPRVKKRCKRALQYALIYTNPNSPRMLSTRDIDMYFGQQQNNISKQLRKLLLIEHNSFYNWQTHKMKQYLRNDEGCRWLQHQLDPTIPYETVEENALEEYTNSFAAELSTGNFVYKDKSDRHWHPLQNMPSAQRKRELSKYGYRHIYDIKCAAPSIILYLAQDLGIKLKHTSTIEHYIANRKEIRQSISNDIGISISDTKKLLTMLFNGAPIGFSSKFASTELLKGDSRTINAVKNHPYISELRQDIRKCWQKISNHQIDGEYIIPRTYKEDGKKKRISSKDRWRVYFAYERYVMDSVEVYLKKQLAKYFIEHDGWSSNIQVDIAELTQHVRTTTGISTIDFEYECY